MTDHTVEIPADVRDNSVRVVRVTSRDEREREGSWPASRHLNDYRERAAFFGYTLHEWDGTDRNGHRVTYTWFGDTTGAHVWVYETSYFTRVACFFTRVACLTDCAGYAQHYASITDQDGVTTVATPYCGECMRSLRRSARDSGMTLNLSEPLRIGQHD